MTYRWKVAAQKGFGGFKNEGKLFTTWSCLIIKANPVSFTTEGCNLQNYLRTYYDHLKKADFKFQASKFILPCLWFKVGIYTCSQNFLDETLIV
jgi:hypothetical protein